MDCWEYNDCPAHSRRLCPAFPDRGTECWKVSGTMCGGGRILKANIAEKIEFCRHCEYYLKYASIFRPRHKPRFQKNTL